MKCIISGCEIPARAQLHSNLFTTSWHVCGVHRRALSELLNKARDAYLIKEKAARHAMAKVMIEGLDELGDHDLEKDLAAQLSLAT